MKTTRKTQLMQRGMHDSGLCLVRCEQNLSSPIKATMVHLHLPKDTTGLVQPYWLKITNFPYPILVQCPRWGWPLSNLWKSFTDPETRVFQTADSEDLVILACTAFDWSTHVTNRWMNEWTDRIAMAKTHYSSSRCHAKNHLVDLKFFFHE